MTGPRRFRIDPTVQRHGAVVIGGSPLKLFRVTDAGAAVVARLVRGEAVADSKLVGALLDAGAALFTRLADDLADSVAAWTS